MNTIFESPNGKVVRNAVGHTVETRGGEQLLIRDLAAELERLQAANANLRAACEAWVKEADMGIMSGVNLDCLVLTEAALAETAP